MKEEKRAKRKIESAAVADAKPELLGAHYRDNCICSDGTSKHGAHHPPIHTIT
jgi:hypothetical protein